MSNNRKYNTPSARLGNYNLARPAERRQVKSMLVNLQLQTENLTKKDLRTWRTAWQWAIDVHYPNRTLLYDIYNDTQADMHLSGCMGQRAGYVKNKSFKLVDRKGVENPEVTELFETPWFKTLVELALESRGWGHSLIQLGDIIAVDGKPAFSEVLLVPRRHVIPEKGVIVTYQNECWENGYDYRHSDMADWIIEAGNPFDLGLYLKCAQHTIPKKNMFAYWDQFGEIFGMPVRIGKTTSRDPREHSKMEKMLAGMGAAAWGLFPEGTEIEIKETTRGDAFNVYDKRIERANSELSKGVLTQTMTTDNGSSLSQSEVHKEMLMNLVNTDADFIRDLVNFQLIPKMTRHGFPVKGFRFDWDESIDFTPEQMVAYERMILENYEVDATYFINKYNMPIIGKKETLNPDPAAGQDGADGKNKKKQQLVKPFFD